MGRIFEVSEKIDIDAFGRYSLTSIGGSDTDLSSGTLNAGAGITAKVAKILSLDLNGQFFTGARDGIAGSLQIKFQF
ncbi:MAG: hypothetical protein FWH43_01145 [Endomicrobia bacterium]|nr:hypothetical protein [Endomicrobiia bacterium]